jgi:hypothetical protein
MSSWNGAGKLPDIGPSHVLHLLLSAARLHLAARHASRQASKISNKIKFISQMS